MRKRDKIKGLFALAAAACCSLGVAGFIGNAETNEAEKATFAMKDGAAVRLTAYDEKYGIRFAADVSDYNEEISYNMLILPDVYRTAYYNSGSAQNIAEWAIGKYGEDNLAIVKNCPYNAEEKIVYGSMVDIRYQNLNRDFCGYAYYQTENGKYVVSAEAGDPLRSIKDVAEKAILSGKYDSDPEKLAVLNGYMTKAAKQAAGIGQDEKLSLNKSEIYASENESVQLNFGVSLNSALTTFVSTDESVCTVDENGLVSMIAPGTAKIKAAYCGETAECAVNVHGNTFDFADENDMKWFSSDGPEMTVENGELKLTQVSGEGKTSVVKFNRRFSAGDVIEITLRSGDGSDTHFYVYGLTETNGAGLNAFYGSTTGISARMTEEAELGIGGKEKHTVTLKVKQAYKGLYIDLHKVQYIDSIGISPDKTVCDFSDEENFMRFQSDNAEKMSVDRVENSALIACNDESNQTRVRFFKDLSAGDKLLIDSEGNGYVYLYGVNDNGDIVVDILGENDMSGSKVHTFTVMQKTKGVLLSMHKDATLKIRRIEVVKAGTDTSGRTVFEFDSLAELADVTGKNGTNYYLENGKLILPQGTQQIRFRRSIKEGTAIIVTLGNTNGDAWAYGTNGNLDIEINHLLRYGRIAGDTDIKGTGTHTVTLIAKDSFEGLGFNFSGTGDVSIERIAFVENTDIFTFEKDKNTAFFDTYGEALRTENDSLMVPVQENGNVQKIRFNKFIAQGTKISVVLGDTHGDAWAYGATNGDGGNGGAKLLEKDGTVADDTSLKGDGIHTVVLTAVADINGIVMNFNNAADIVIYKIVVGEDTSSETEYVLPEYDESLEMNVGVWNGSYVNFTQEDINALKEAGINVLVGNYPTSGDFLNMAAEAGISVIPFAKDWDTQTVDFSSDEHLNYFQKDRLPTMEKTTLKEKTGFLKYKTYNVLHVVANKDGDGYNNVLWFRKPLAAGAKVTITMKADGDVFAYGINGNTYDASMIAETQIAVGGAGKTSTTLSVLKDTDGIFIMFNMPGEKTESEGYIYSIDVGESALPAYVRNGTVLGMCVYDEPALADLEKVGLTQAAFRNLLEENYLEDKIFFVNLLPDYAGFTTESYREYVEAYLEKANPEVLSVDYYALMKDGTVRSTFFSNLNYLAGKAKEKNIPLWYTMLTAQHGDYADPATEQLRWQAAVAMTYGAKGIMHYVYSGDTDHSGLMKQENGQWVKNEELFAKVSEIDKEIALWDHIYLSYTWQQTGTVGESDLFSGLTAYADLENKGALTTVTAESGAAICGVFTDANGNYGYMLTNESNVAGARMQVSFGAEYNAVALIRNGVTSIVKISDLSAIALAAGEGVFMIPLK